MDVNTLNTLVSSAIWRAEQLEDLGLEAARSAWVEVSSLEEELAKAIPAEQAEGRIARRGAVRAALKANDVARAGIGFDSDRNEVTIITPTDIIAVPEAGKLDIAQKILEAAIRIRQQQVAPVPASTSSADL